MTGGHGKYTWTTYVLVQPYCFACAFPLHSLLVFFGNIPRRKCLWVFDHVFCKFSTKSFKYTNSILLLLSFTGSVVRNQIGTKQDCSRQVIMTTVNMLQIDKIQVSFRTEIFTIFCDFLWNFQIVLNTMHIFLIYLFFFISED